MTVFRVFHLIAAVPDTPTLWTLTLPLSKWVMDWTTCASRLAELDLSTAQKANALNLLSVVTHLPAPDEMTINSYDCGISLHWDRYELATFADHYETYQFSDGETIIHHWPHLPQEALDDAMILEIMAATN